MGLFDKIAGGLKKTRDALMGSIGDVLQSFTRIDKDLELLGRRGLNAQKLRHLFRGVWVELKPSFGVEPLQRVGRVLFSLQLILFYDPSVYVHTAMLHECNNV